MDDRRQQARDVRNRAAELAYARAVEKQQANDEESRYRFDAGAKNGKGGASSYIARFTKGLPHGDDGMLLDPRDYDDFAEAIESGSYEEFRRVRIGPRADTDADRDADTQDNPPAAPPFKVCNACDVRKWESPTAGHVFDLEGPDAQALALPPAPELDSDELVAEMAEVYAMALLRDVPFNDYATNPQAAQLFAFLQQLPWFDGSHVPGLSDAAQARRRRLTRLGQLFRGITAGDVNGRYISQFLIAGPTGNPGGTIDYSEFLEYGAIRIDLRVREARTYDFMTTWNEWLDVQNGAKVDPRLQFPNGSASYRLITTGRDLATYVHFDQLYEAYLNAALHLLTIGAPRDRGLPLEDEPTQEGFATFGGPHLLALLTEVSFRALKAVRYQKFNIHRRPRPEAVGGLLDLYDRGMRGHGVEAALAKLHALTEAPTDDADLFALVKAHNAAQESSEGDAAANKGANVGSLLLPMAFPEGSPMHPAYGAGHATVAGACTTILKAWFDCGHVLPEAWYVDGSGKLAKDENARLTVGGELDKLAANISIGRNFGGVHYFTDYWESLLLGEKIALGILEEQKLTYPESFHLEVPPFRRAPEFDAGPGAP